MNGDLIVNASDSIDVANGTLAIPHGVSVENKGSIYGHGRLENNGTLTIRNLSSFGIATVNWGRIDNYANFPGLDLLNHGIFANAGTLDIGYRDTLSNNGTIENTNQIDISYGATIDNFLNATISNYGSGIIINPLDGSLVTLGTINNQGVINNNGTIVNNGSGAFLPAYQITVKGIIDNSNYIFNGKFGYHHGAIINGRYGSIYNHFDDAQATWGQILNYASIDNYGLLNNDGSGGVGWPGAPPGSAVYLNNQNGTINNYDQGTITLYYYSHLENYGKITFENGRLFNDRGIINNWIGTINNKKGNIANGYIFNNYDTINNNGSITNLRSIGGNIWYGALENWGTVNNNGNVTNHWDIANYRIFNNEGTIYNNGTIFRDYKGTFINHNGGSITNYGSGTVTDCVVYLLHISTLPESLNYTTNGCGSTDYILQISTPSLTVLQGRSAVVKLSVASSTGVFPGNITLTPPQLPQGITASLTSSEISQLSFMFASYVNMTIRVSDSVAPGSYSIRIDGTSAPFGQTGPLAHSANLTIIVILPPDFMITASSTLNIDTSCPYCPDYTGNLPMTITPLYEFYGTVNFNVTSPPTLSCEVLIVGGGFASPLRLSGSPSKLLLSCTTDGNNPGDYNVTVTATSGHLMKQLNVTVHIKSANSTPTSPSFKLPSFNFPFSPLIALIALGGILVLVVILVLGLRMERRRRSRFPDIPESPFPS